MDQFQSGRCPSEGGGSGSFALSVIHGSRKGLGFAAQHPRELPPILSIRSNDVPEEFFDNESDLESKESSDKESESEESSAEEDGVDFEQVTKPHAIVTKHPRKRLIILEDDDDDDDSKSPVIEQVTKDPRKRRIILEDDDDDDDDDYTTKSSAIEQLSNHPRNLPPLGDRSNDGGTKAKTKFQRT